MVIGLMLLSAAACLARPDLLEGPRRLAAPVLAPLSYPLAYVTLRVRDNGRALLEGQTDRETLERLLEEHPELREPLVEMTDQTLRRQVLSYEEQIVQLQQRVLEMQEWRRGLQSLQPEFAYRLIPGTVVGGDAVPYHDSRLLYVPEHAADGSFVTTRTVLTRQPTALPVPLAALSGSALVGRVDVSSAWTARLQTVLDADFAIDAYVKRDPARPREIEIEETVDGQTRLRRRELRPEDPPVPVNLRGRGRPTMITDEAPRRHGIAPGDWVVTMGTDGLLPFGVVIGRVSGVSDADNPQHVRVEVAPSADLAGLREVYVVLPRGVPVEP